MGTVGGAFNKQPPSGPQDAAHYHFLGALCRALCEGWTYTNTQLWSGGAGLKPKSVCPSPKLVVSTVQTYVELLAKRKELRCPSFLSPAPTP